MKFIAIDFETANPDLASICQIGTVTFNDYVIEKKWQTLINPEDYFDPINIGIHGISEDKIKNVAKFPDIYNSLKNLISDEVTVCHTHFDKVALVKVTEKYQLPQILCRWLDTVKVVRRTWSQFSQKGYGLKNVANELGIDFKHHEAVEDARVAGEILIRAIKETGMSVDEWISRINKPIDLLHDYKKISRKGNPEGHLFGEVVLFTYELSIPRKQAAELASIAGCEVASSVRRDITLLVVGDQDIRKLAGHDKSSKHRKAEELISEGYPIRILSESDFQRLINI